MGDRYPSYCSSCVNKDVSNDVMPCAGDGYPPFWPHNYPNCFAADAGVEIAISGKVIPAPEEPTAIEMMVEAAETPEEIMEALTSDEMMEEMDRIVEEEPVDEAEVKALAGDASVVDEILATEGAEEEIDDAEDEDELYGGDVVEEEPEAPIKAHADVDAKGLYYCTECEHNHKYGSKLGKEHVEFAGDPPQD